MPVQRGGSAAVINDHTVPIAPRIRCQQNSAARCRMNGSAGLHPKIHAGMQFAPMQNGMIAIPESRSLHSVDGLDESSVPDSRRLIGNLCNSGGFLPARFAAFARSIANRRKRSRSRRNASCRRFSISDNARMREVMAAASSSKTSSSASA